MKKKFLEGGAISDKVHSLPFAFQCYQSFPHPPHTQLPLIEQLFHSLMGICHNSASDSMLLMYKNGATLYSVHSVNKISNIHTHAHIHTQRMSTGLLLLPRARKCSREMENTGLGWHNQPKK